MSDRPRPLVLAAPFAGDETWSPAGMDQGGPWFAGVRFESRELAPPEEYLRCRELSYLARLISTHVRLSGYDLNDPEPVLLRQLAWFLNESLFVIEAAWEELKAHDPEWC